MTGAELMTEVNTYLASHLDASYWSSLTSSVKTGAVTMALNDVQAELSGMTLGTLKSESFAVKAIAEQAVFLARNYSDMTEGKVVTGESVEGISNSYTLISDKAGISFRAAAFIKKAKSAITGCSVHISRG